ncbi:hypothetical protein B0I31_11317 [Saccharothrix carnea]|uniref:Uncharacterized protein n=1 Tax=Saccharothrix carnea TaxID=1280637 RepID=A0A2P8I1L7_SACCR|nr:hypothetical protein [Saccharothrix carnea]PSL52345.1 hypothetical protein B0I31_11317 [Saccharothrix carnea]
MKARLARSLISPLLYFSGWLFSVACGWMWWYSSAWLPSAAAEMPMLPHQSLAPASLATRKLRKKYGLPTVRPARSSGPIDTPPVTPRLSSSRRTGSSVRAAGMSCPSRVSVDPLHRLRIVATRNQKRMASAVQAAPDVRLRR